jgi:hypothetical protein
MRAFFVPESRSTMFLACVAALSAAIPSPAGITVVVGTVIAAALFLRWFARLPKRVRADVLELIRALRRR